MDQQSPQSIMSDLSWRISSLETKVKLNEQNFFNLQERMQLINKNFLDLKKELRDRVDNLTDEAHDIEKTVKDLQSKVEKVGSKLATAPRGEDVEQIKKFHETINVFKPEMSADEAKNILDGVLKQLEK